jgi:hypothetical protein
MEPTSDEEYEDDSDFDDNSEGTVDQAPKRLRFSIGGYMGKSYQVSWIPEIRSLRVRAWEFGYKNKTEHLSNVTDAQWKTFWAVMDKLNVWGWRREYSTDVCDGTTWHLDVINGSRRIRSHGSNAYPDGDDMHESSPAFDTFLAAINMLAGRNDII